MVFRCRAADPDQLNARLRRRLLQAGSALVGRTEVELDGRPAVCLKLTLLNPATTPSDIEELLDLVVETGHEIKEVTP